MTDETTSVETATSTPTPAPVAPTPGPSLKEDFANLEQVIVKTVEDAVTELKEVL